MTTPLVQREPVPTGLWDSFRHAFSSPQRFRTEVFGGLVVALAIIPEVISFSVLAGLDPRVGLFTSVIMAVVIAFTGGRPAMITGAAGATALVIAPLVASHGVNYLIAAVLLGGAIQLLLAFLGVAKLQRFIPRSVMTGFVNALAILIFLAQVPHLIDVPWLVYPMVAVMVLIMIFFPRFTTAVPAPLVGIVLLTAVVFLFDVRVPDVADMGELPTTLPGLILPDIPYTLETLQIIAPYALGVALVGLMESLMTAKLVDDITDSHSDKTRESLGQGLANIASGLFGGMGGCAMIGQTMINVNESRARTRLSALLAGVFLLILVVTLNEIVGMIPMAALVGVMIMISIGTFDWHSVRPRTLRMMPLSETLVMLVTVIATLATDNLAVGVVLGVLTAMIAFARRVAHLVDVDRVETAEQVTYQVRGQLFWASSNDLVYQFSYESDAAHGRPVLIDLSTAEVWDASTVASLDAILRKYHDRGIDARIRGLSGVSLQRLEALSGNLD